MEKDPLKEAVQQQQMLFICININRLNGSFAKDGAPGGQLPAADIWVYYCVRGRVEPKNKGADYARAGLFRRTD